MLPSDLFAILSAILIAPHLTQRAARAVVAVFGVMSIAWSIWFHLPR